MHAYMYMHMYIFISYICVSCHVLNRCRTTAKSLSFIWSTNMILIRQRKKTLMIRSLATCVMQLLSHKRL